MNKYQNFIQLAFISVCILLLYTAFNSTADLQSEIMKTDGYDELGFYVLAILYFFMGLGSLMSTAAINKFGTRGCLLLGGIGNTVMILCMIIPAGQQEGLFPNLPRSIIVTIIFVGTVTNGLTVGILWASAN